MHTFSRQTMDDWELIVIDDNSQDDVKGTVMPYMDDLRIRYFRLEHDFGMRGNTASINFGLERAKGDVVMWSTPEVMLPPDALQAAYDVLVQRPDELLWVTIPSHGLSIDVQFLIDSVPWQQDVHRIKQLVGMTNPEDWDSVWFNLNFYENGRRDGKSKRELGIEFGNNQTVAVIRNTFREKIGTFPQFGDYGSDDPWIASERKRAGYRDVTLWDQEAYHQWHPPCQFWMALGNAPNWNAKGHSTSNPTGDSRVPENGTCQTWDQGNTDPLTDEQVADMLKMHEVVTATGFRYKGGGVILSPEVYLWVTGAKDDGPSNG